MGGVKLLGVEVVVDCVCPIPWRVVSSCADVAWIVGVLSSSSSKMVSKSQYSPFISPVGDVWRRLDLGYSQGPSESPACVVAKSNLVSRSTEIHAHSRNPFLSAKMTAVGHHLFSVVQRQHVADFLVNRFLCETRDQLEALLDKTHSRRSADQSMRQDRLRIGDRNLAEIRCRPKWT